MNEDRSQQKEKSTHSSGPRNISSGDEGAPVEFLRSLKDSSPRNPVDRLGCSKRTSHDWTCSTNPASSSSLLENEATKRSEAKFVLDGSGPFILVVVKARWRRITCESV